MSFFSEDAASGRSTVISSVGTDSADAIVCDNFMVRLTPALDVIQIKTVSTVETVEIFRYAHWGAGSVEPQKLTAQVLSPTVWTPIDAVILNSGDDRVEIWVCRSAVSDPEWFEFKVWHPTQTKACLTARKLTTSPARTFLPGTNTLVRTGDLLTSTVNGVVSSLSHDSRRIVHHHRVVLGDAPVVANFNGNAYQYVNWVPRIAGRKLNTAGVTNYTNFGLNWRINALNQWELYGDAVGVAPAQESWVVDVSMTRHSVGLMKIYGAFN